MEYSYRQALALDLAPILTPRALTEEVRARVSQGWRVLAFFGLPEEDGHDAVGLLCVLGHDATGVLAALRTPPLTAWPSLTPVCPQVHLFEREIHEQWGLVPQGHPWLKPVRFPTRPGQTPPVPAGGDFFHVDGGAVHEVAVGPVHAGVIEPGHFRFQCYGETVMHLEIALGFQHRGAERRLTGAPSAHVFPLVECLAGDSSIAHATAYCTLLETLAGQSASPRGQSLRRVALELERLACHTGDLGALGGDAGFLPTASWCGRIRGDFLNMTALLCGNRFGRGLVRPGGVTRDLDDALIDELRLRLRATHRDMRGAVDVMLESPGVLARFHGVGALSAETARSIGLTGVAAKACGLAQDARFQYPLSGLPEAQATLRTHPDGDVYARAIIRSQEADDAVRIIEAELDDLRRERPADSSSAPPALAGACCVPPRPVLTPRHLAVALVEGWRGTVCHVGVTDAAGRLRACKVVDPSFHNWFGLAHALRGQQISDFPLCNKSFNLSYCGHDL